MSAAAISVRGLRKSYGEHEAVSGIDFEVDRGEVFVFLGPNGAGKTTTIERHGPLTPSELAELERVKRPTVTRTLGCLEREGLVERAADPSDGRSALVSVNAAGRERLRRLRGRKNAYLAKRMRDLPAEDVAVLERAAEILEQMLEEPRGGRGGGA